MTTGILWNTLQDFRRTALGEHHQTKAKPDHCTWHQRNKDKRAKAFYLDLSFRNSTFAWNHFILQTLDRSLAAIRGYSSGERPTGSEGVKA